MSLTGLAFMFGFLALLLATLTLHPRYGLYAYLVAFYVHPPSRWWGEGLPDLRWSLLASIVTLISVWRMRTSRSNSQETQRVSWLKTTPARLLIVWTVWLWIQWLWALDRDMQGVLAVAFTKYVILYYVLYEICSTPEEVGRFLFAHVAGCAFLGYLALGVDVSGRLEGVGGPGIDEANAMAMQLSTAIPCGAMIVLTKRNWQFVFTSVAIALILNAIVLAGSRGAFLALLASGLCLYLMKPREHRMLFYALAAVAIVAFFSVANKNFWDRMSTMEAAVDEQQQMDNSAESRFALAEAQFKMAIRYPWGTGHRGTEVLSPQYLADRFLTHKPDGTPGARSSHNTFLSAWVEQGFPGAVIFISLVLWCRRASRESFKAFSSSGGVQERSVLASTSAALMIVLVAGMFVDYLKAEVTIWLLAALASLYEYSVPKNLSETQLVRAVQSRHLKRINHS